MQLQSDPSDELTLPLAYLGIHSLKHASGEWKACLRMSPLGRHVSSANRALPSTSRGSWKVDLN